MRAQLRAIFLGLTIAMIAGSSGASPIHAQDADTEYAHPEWLAEAGWLRQQLGDDSLTVIALTPAKEFAAGHIPGSAQIGWNALEVVDTTDASLAGWQSDVEAILTELGIERDDTVVIYDGGTFFAPRLWWILHQLGHDDVRILNGGLEAWVAEGGDLETGEAAVLPAAVPYTGEPDDDVLVSIAEAEAALDQDDTIFVDARRFEDEYTAGHIPGAINVPFIDNAEASGPIRWKSASALRAMYEEAGVTPDRFVIAYCTTGVRSAATYFALRQLGYDVSLFSGSFVEWSSDPSRPVTTGPTP